jgi:predicted dehydrogenase
MLPCLFCRPDKGNRRRPRRSRRYPLAPPHDLLLLPALPHGQRAAAIGDAVIRVGIVGSNFGRAVLLPAFRADPRCEVVALAGRDAQKTDGLAREAGVARAFKTWTELVEDGGIDAVAIATPPALQPDIAIQALQAGKAVFLEKPLAATLAQADVLLDQARKSKRPAMIDFEFPELPAWQRAKALIDEGAIGALRHVVVSWQVENFATRMRLKSWKTNGDDGGGVLGNFVSHCFHYLECFCGPLANLSAQLFGLPSDRNGTEATVALTGEFASGAGLSLSMSAASYLGSGHRIEFYGEDGTLMLVNATADLEVAHGVPRAPEFPESLEAPEAAERPLKSPQTPKRSSRWHICRPVSRIIRLGTCQGKWLALGQVSELGSQAQWLAASF